MTARGMGAYQRFFHAAFFFLLLVLPLMRGAWDQWSQTLAALVLAFFLALGGLLAGLGRARDEGLPVGFPPPLAPAFGLMASVLLVSAALSPYPHSVYPAFLNELLCFVFFAAAAALPVEKRPLFARAIAGAAVLSVLAALLARPRSGAAVGLLVNANVLAGVLVLGTPLAAAFAGRLAVGRPARVLWATAAAACVVGLVLTGSLTGFIVLLCQAALLYAFLWHRPGRSWMVAAVCASAAAAAGAWIFSADLGKLLGEADRWSWWRGALAMAAAHPVWGVGPGAFGEAYPAFRVETWGLNSLYAHNFLLEALAEKGLIFVAALVFVLYRSWTSSRPRSSPLAAALTIGTAGFCLYNLAHIGFAFPALAWLFWAALGLLWMAPRPGSRGAGFLLAGAALLIAGGSWVLFRAGQLTEMARLAIPADRPGAGALVEKALAWNPRSPALHEMRAALAYAAGDRSGAKEALARAVALAPTSAGFRREAAELALDDGDGAEALRQYDRAVQLLPLDPMSWLRRGDILAAAGRNGEARKSFENALRALADRRVMAGNPARRAEIETAVKGRLEKNGNAENN